MRGFFGGNGSWREEIVWPGAERVEEEIGVKKHDVLIKVKRSFAYSGIN